MSATNSRLLSRPQATALVGFHEVLVLGWVIDSVSCCSFELGIERPELQVKCLCKMAFDPDSHAPSRSFVTLQAAIDGFQYSDVCLRKRIEHGPHNPKGSQASQDLVIRARQRSSTIIARCSFWNGGAGDQYVVCEVSLPWRFARQRSSLPTITNVPEPVQVH
jgi:hypothetical protein